MWTICVVWRSSAMDTLQIRGQAEAYRIAQGLADHPRSVRVFVEGRGAEQPARHLKWDAPVERKLIARLDLPDAELLADAARRFGVEIQDA